MPPEALPATAPGSYGPLLIVAALAVAFAVVSLGASTVVTALVMKGRRRSPAKETPYECGMPVLSDARTRFSVKFYLVAMLFILFDIEVVFLYPWAVLYGMGDASRDGIGLGFLLAELVVFALVLLAGWWYIVKKGVLEWQSEG
jgi:NADH-quinone oxidoreductase subunit A